MKILFSRLRTVLKKSCPKFWRDGRVPRLFASLYTLSFCAAPFRKNLFVCILRFEFIPRYLFSRNFGNARFLSPRPTDRSHNFPPILMEHQRGHVSSTFPLSALINPRPTPRIFRSSRVSSPAGNSSGGRKNKKAGSETRGNWIARGCCTLFPDLQTHDTPRDSRLFIGDALKPRKIASARP